MMQEPANPSPSSASTQQLVHPGDFPRIPGYRFLRRLGQGGMATVYLAIQESLDRPVSIKVMELESLQDEVSKQRFEHEARTIAKITHPCIVSIYEVGRTVDGQMYYIMPYLPNGDLAQRDLTHNEPRIIEVLRALLSGLEYAHARGIVHRDVKEENVLFDSADRPLLTDFGIALSKRDTSRITTAGLAVGSSGYMAPEQARGEVVDGRADLYSVGVLAYELLVGELPFNSPEPLAMALMHAQKPVPRLPPEKRHWQEFIDKAMEKSPEHRYRNAQQMLHALERISLRTSSNPVSRLLLELDTFVATRPWRQPWAWAALGAVLIVLGLFVFRGRLPSRHPEADNSPFVTAQAPAAALPAPEVTKPNASVVAPIVSPTAAAAVDPNAPPTDAPLAGPSPEMQAAIAAARDQLTHGNLTAPAGHNAVELAQALWKLAPGTADAHSLVADVLAALSTQLAHAIAQARDERALTYRQTAQQLATATVGIDDRAYKTLQANAGKALGQRVRNAVNSDDTAALSSAHALADKLELADVYAREAARPRDPNAGMPVARLPAGLRPLHESAPGHAAVAMMHREVTRSEYAAFASATGRPSASCSQRTGLGLFAKRKSWSDPGYPQGGDHPVTCVSWDDAHAYAAWLSARTGVHYRLPTQADWIAATASGAGGNPTSGKGTSPAAQGGSNSLGLVGLADNASEWLQDCAGGCDRHHIAGGSWRVRSGVASSNTEPGDRGYDDVGFRLVADPGSKR
jgi:formylglycine-generating enzyme required for sulfatase activity/tRNA A-37 threonylcarbamoyl transferase component Bud32